MSAKDWQKLLLLSFIWGGSYLFGSIAVKGWPTGSMNGLPPLSIVLVRAIVASLTLLIALRIMRIAIPTSRTAWAAFLGMGLINNAMPHSLIFLGQSQMSADVAVGLAAILNATTPIFTVAIAHVMLEDEKVTPLKILGLIFGIIGVVVMIGIDFLSHIGVSILGQILCLAAAFCYGLAGLYSRRFKALDVQPMQIAFGQVTASAIIMIPLVMMIDRPWTLPMPGTVPLLALLALGVVATGLAYILFFQILASAGATNLSLVTFIIPPSAILMGVIVIGESLKTQHFIGLFFIALGLSAIDGRLWQHFKRSG
jgi:drug/metabolite transporter (DMT)-like permease